MGLIIDRENQLREIEKRGIKGYTGNIKRYADSINWDASREKIAKDMYKMFERNPILVGHWYFKKYFRRKTPKFHVKIIETIKENEYVVVQCPRGSAKSTIITFLYSVHSMLFKKKNFIIILQNTFKKAADSLRDIQIQFKDNNKLREDFNIKFIKDSYGDAIFNINGKNIRVLCFGAEQIGKIRGSKYDGYRPDLIICDDVEDDELVRSKERRDILLHEFKEAVLPAGAPGETKYIVIGTVLHDASLIAKLLYEREYKHWKKLFYQAKYVGIKSGKVKSLWPAQWTVAELEDKEKNDPISFAKEYQGNPVPEKNRKFKKENFRYWYVSNGDYVLLNEYKTIIKRGRLSDCIAGIGCDLAWESKKQNDYTVILPAYFTPDSEILVEEYFCKKGVRPDEFEEVLFTLENRLKSITGKSIFIGFEKGKLEKVMKWCMRQAMHRRNHFLNFKDMIWATDKITRMVTPLQPRYSMHAIFHRSGMAELEYQLLRIPSGEHDDLPDALQMLTQIFKYPPKAKKYKPSEDIEYKILKRLCRPDVSLDKIRYIFGNKRKKFFSIKAEMSLQDILQKK